MHVDCHKSSVACLSHSELASSPASLAGQQSGPRQCQSSAAAGLVIPAAIYDPDRGWLTTVVHMATFADLCSTQVSGSAQEALIKLSSCGEISLCGGSGRDSHAPGCKVQRILCGDPTASWIRCLLLAAVQDADKCCCTNQ